MEEGKGRYLFEQKEAEFYCASMLSVVVVNMSMDAERHPTSERERERDTNEDTQNFIQGFTANAVCLSLPWQT